MAKTIVIVIKAGAPKKSVELEGDKPTVGQLRQQLEAGKMLASVNGDAAQDGDVLSDGSVVTFTEQVKGA